MHQIIETFLLAMTPIGELRLAIPIGITVYKLHWALAYFVAVIGNLVPAVFLLLFLKPVSNWLIKYFKIFEKFFNWLFSRTRQRVGDRVQKHGALALTLFVSIPLPITGAWTGCVVAFLFGMSFKKAFTAIASGVVISGLIVLVLTFSGIAIEQYLGWQALLIIVAIVVISSFVVQKIRSNK